MFRAFENQKSRRLKNERGETFGLSQNDWRFVVCFAGRTLFVMDHNNIYVSFFFSITCFGLLWAAINPTRVRFWTTTTTAKTEPKWIRFSSPSKIRTSLRYAANEYDEKKQKKKIISRNVIHLPVSHRYDVIIIRTESYCNADVVLGLGGEGAVTNRDTEKT